MSLWQVTITGADDGVDPQALIDVSAHYPFVEWGILLSKSRAGTPRYPTHRWIEKLQRLCYLRGGAGERPHLSAHACGAYVKAVRDGDLDFTERLPCFGRMQLNGYVGIDVVAVEALAELLACKTEMNVILQLPKAEYESSALFALSEHAREHMHRVHTLYDPSAGKGIPARWPLWWNASSLPERPREEPRLVPGGPRLTNVVEVPTVAGGYRGLAGGIRVTNVVEVVRHIEASYTPKHPPVRCPRYWIDLESGARDAAGAFSVALVEEILELTRPMIYQERCTLDPP